MQVFFAWVAAQKLSSCKQRIITSCTRGLHNKRYGSTHYDARSASRGNLRAILIVFIFCKKEKASYEAFSNVHVIMSNRQYANALLCVIHYT